MLVVYFEKKHKASETCRRLVEVRCAKCDCNYFYELTREGRGAEGSPFFLFEDYARETAAAKARENAKQLLASEAELVPCPKCHWVNEELIEGYRRSCFRGWIEQSIWIGVIGAGLCVFPLVTSVGIPGHSGEVFFFAVVVPTLLFLMVIGVFLFVRTMRMRIQPNLKYPSPPRLPRRVPMRLMLEPESGQLVPASKIVGK